MNDKQFKIDNETYYDRNNKDWRTYNIKVKEFIRKSIFADEIVGYIDNWGI